MTVAVTQDLLSGMPLVLKIELIRLWSSILPEPGQPSAQLSKLIHLTTCKKAMHATSRWYRAVYIAWLVASYDMHKGKCWLNSNPQTTAQYLLYRTYCTVLTVLYLLYRTYCTGLTVQDLLYSTYCTVLTAQYLLHSTYCTGLTVQ